MISVYFTAALLAFGAACLWLYAWAAVWDKLRLPARWRWWHYKTFGGRRIRNLQGKKGMNRTKTVTPLTDEQRQFAEENANLIWWFINKHRLGFNDPEKRNDWYCDLAETFLIAVQKYHPEMGTFVSFAHECMWRKMRWCLTFQNRQMRSKMTTVSINAPVKDGSNTPSENFLQTEYRSTEDAAVDHVYASEILTQIWPVLTEKHKEAVLARAFYEEDWRGAAASIDIKPFAFKQRIRYARLRIKEKVPLELQFQQDT